ncbi:uncharacterized protein [Henckelia pumila]|uniref:uncharacterized protein isoform X2 n=1 Tax=Henckelia pumila TaxID=405737 RepID=UPI003C6E18E2
MKENTRYIRTDCVFPTYNVNSMILFQALRVGKYNRKNSSGVSIHLMLSMIQYTYLLVTGELYTAACSPTDPTLVATGGGDDKGFLWKIKVDCTFASEGHPYHAEGLTCLTINSDSSLVLTGSNDGSVHIVNISTGKVLLLCFLSFQLSMPLICVGVVSLLTKLAVFWVILLIDLATFNPQVVSSLSAHSESLDCAAFYVRGGYPMAATGGMDNKLIIWDLQHSSPRCTCDHEDGVICFLWLAGSRQCHRLRRWGKFECGTFSLETMQNILL